MADNDKWVDQDGKIFAWNGHTNRSTNLKSAFIGEKDGLLSVNLFESIRAPSQTIDQQLISCWNVLIESLSKNDFDQLARLKEYGIIVYQLALEQPSSAAKEADDFFSNGVNGFGRNYVGKMYMLLRALLLNAQNQGKEFSLQNLRAIPDTIIVMQLLRQLPTYEEATFSALQNDKGKGIKNVGPFPYMNAAAKIVTRYFQLNVVSEEKFQDYAQLIESSERDFVQASSSKDDALKPANSDFISRHTVAIKKRLKLSGIFISEINFENQIFYIHFANLYSLNSFINQLDLNKAILTKNDCLQKEKLKIKLNFDQICALLININLQEVAQDLIKQQFAIAFKAYKPAEAQSSQQTRHNKENPAPDLTLTNEEILQKLYIKLTDKEELDINIRSITCQGDFIVFIFENENQIKDFNEAFSISPLVTELMTPNIFVSYEKTEINKLLGLLEMSQLIIEMPKPASPVAKKYSSLKRRGGVCSFADAVREGPVDSAATVTVPTDESPLRTLRRFFFNEKFLLRISPWFADTYVLEFFFKKTERENIIALLRSKSIEIEFEGNCCFLNAGQLNILCKESGIPENLSISDFIYDPIGEDLQRWINPARGSIPWKMWSEGKFEDIPEELKNKKQILMQLKNCCAAILADSSLNDYIRLILKIGLLQLIELVETKNVISWNSIKNFHYLNTVISYEDKAMTLEAETIKVVLDSSYLAMHCLHLIRATLESTACASNLVFRAGYESLD